MTAKQPIMLGRKDYLIRSLDPSTGAEHWNVTYSEIVHLDLDQSSADDSSSSTDIASLGNHEGDATARLSKLLISSWHVKIDVITVNEWIAVETLYWEMLSVSVVSILVEK